MKLLKQIIAGFILRRRFKKHRFNNQSFSSVFANAKAFLVLMPETEDDFQYAVSILEHLEKNNKDFFILTYDYRVSMLPLKYRGKAIGHGIRDVNKFDLPSKVFLTELKKKNFDAVLDLNRKEQMFYIFVSCVINTGISIGFTKKLADKVYNLQIANDETNPKISYENLLSCLKML
jgi:hypothetical protein